jgi:hypothetical protein
MKGNKKKRYIVDKYCVLQERAHAMHVHHTLGSNSRNMGERGEMGGTVFNLSVLYVQSGANSGIVVILVVSNISMG